MGQYYLALVKQPNNVIQHAAFMFLKLMESSYVGNPLPEYIMTLILDSPARIVWTGDYADPEKPNPPFLRDYSLFPTDANADLGSNGIGNGEFYNLYGLCGADLSEIPMFKDSPCTFVEANIYAEKTPVKYIVNNTLKLYINYNVYSKKERAGLKIHPLPLLTCEGNGRGGGDYRGSNMGEVGTWARHEIYTTNDEVPAGLEKYEVEFSEYDD